jgi:hypothetical protein
MDLALAFHFHHLGIPGGRKPRAMDDEARVIYLYYQNYNICIG